MKKTNSFLSIAKLFCVSTFLLAPTMVWADYEEVSYDDLLNELNHKKTRVESRNTPIFDDIMIHAGVALISSANSIKMNGHESVLYQSGMQLSFGIDLFTPEWSSEFALRNYGQTTSGNETRSMREFDLKVNYRIIKDSKFSYRLGGGLGTRYIRITDDMAGISVDDSTPSAVAHAGFDTYLNKFMSIGIEAGVRSALVTRTIDKNAIDIALRFDSHF